MTKVVVESNQLAIAGGMHAEVEGIGMGVLPDGTGYLSARGLAEFCGVAPSAITGWYGDWDPSNSARKRDVWINQCLVDAGYRGELFREVLINGTKTAAFPDQVCVAVLQYYAAVVGKPVAVRRAIQLATVSLREFIYQRVGFDPRTETEKSWQCFHDRLLLNEVPSGYFSVFQETSELVLKLIRGGLRIDHHTVPDISLGRTFSDFWKAIDGDHKYGPRCLHPHVYPDYFPQAVARPQAYLYPLGALGQFRIWLEQTYLPSKFPNYLARKVKEGSLPAPRAHHLLKAYAPRALLVGRGES